MYPNSYRKSMSAKISHRIFRNERKTSVSPIIQFEFCVDLCLLISLIPKMMASNNLYLKIIFAKPEEAKRFARWGWSSGKESQGACKGKEHDGVHSHLHTDHCKRTAVNAHFFSQLLEEWPCFVWTLLGRCIFMLLMSTDVPLGLWLHKGFQK